MATKRSKAELLKVRESMKARKPVFVRDDSFKVKRVSPSWRKPKGMHSKQRLKFKYSGRFVSPGFGSPAAVRGMDASGFEPVIVSTPAMVDALDPKLQAICIAGSVGARKRIDILKRAQERKVHVINVKDPSAFIAEAAKAVKDRQADAQKKESVRSSKREASSKKKEETKDEAKNEALDAKVDAASATASSATPSSAKNPSPAQKSASDERKPDMSAKAAPAKAESKKAEQKKV